MREGLVFDIKRYAVHDGPGIRTTVFFKGCPLRCAWCHNPEGQSPRPELMVKPSRCLPGCSACVKACPEGAIVRRGRLLRLDRKKCTACGLCADLCPSEALEMAGRPRTAGDVALAVFQDAIFHEGSGGGVTFSGGEPLAQAPFLMELLEECRRREVHAAVDTCGYVPRRVLEKLMGRVDVFLFDLKTMDDAAHRRYTGVSNKPILDNLRFLSSRGQRVIIRIPLIAGINDDDENIQRTARFLKPLHGIERISLLPYHGLGKNKYAGLDRSAGRAAFTAPAPSRLPQIKAALEAYGFRVDIGD